MALSSIEGCTLGGLDEGRGHNAFILGFRGTMSALDVDKASVTTIDNDGTVVTTCVGDSTTTNLFTVDYGHGMTIQTPVTGDGNLDTIENVFKFTFGVVGTHASGVLTAVADPEVLANSKNNSSIGGQTNAVANANLPFTIQTAIVNCVHVDNESTDLEFAIEAGVTEINGNMISVRLSQPGGADGGDIPIVDTDSLKFNIVAFATANN